MPDAKKEERRDICRCLYHIAVENGYFNAARMMLRDALMWRSPAARSGSKEWVYNLNNGKLHAFEYKSSR